MNLVFVGCEYAGKSTIAAEVMEWALATIGGTSHFHDHFTVPSSEFSSDAQASLKQLHPQALETFQRYQLEYHVRDHFYNNPDHNLMGAAIEEAVYAPLYYGYGGKDSQAPKRSPIGQRSEMARRIEENMLRMAPGSVLVLLKASPSVIAQRMHENPHRHQVVEESDIEHVLVRFEEEFEASLIEKRVVLDTSEPTVEETMAEFIQRHEPFQTEADLIRMKEKQNSQ
jgi:shikimate kinase